MWRRNETDPRCYSVFRDRSTLLPSQWTDSRRKTGQNDVCQADICRPADSVHNLIDKGRRPGLAEIEAHLAATDLKFEISNFSSGAVTDIAQRKFAELVTKPDGQDVLAIEPT